MNYEGSCHCGRIRFTVEGEMGTVMECNCSMCRRRGGLLWFVGRDALRLETPEADMGTYTFNRHLLQHHFCPTCGIAPFSEGNDPQGNATAAVNVRCLEGVDLAELAVQHVDGASR